MGKQTNEGETDGDGKFFGIEWMGKEKEITIHEKVEQVRISGTAETGDMWDSLVWLGSCSAVQRCLTKTLISLETLCVISAR